MSQAALPNAIGNGKLHILLLVRNRTLPFMGYDLTFTRSDLLTTP